MLLQSCEDHDIQKLVVDLTSLFQQPKLKGSMQFQILQNLVSKLKKGNNHRYNDNIKDIAALHRNRLGDSNYSLLQNLFCLPGKTTARLHFASEKLRLGFNNHVFETSSQLYNGEPVIDATDEARYLSAVLYKEGDVELIGQCSDADWSEWRKNKTLLKDIYCLRYLLC